MNRYFTGAIVMLVSMMTATASAATVLSDFSNFNLTGTYEQWKSGSFTSAANDFRVQANDFGGGWKVLSSPIDATGETALEVQLDINLGNVTHELNIVLADGDGSDRVYRFNSLAVGADQTLKVALDDFFQVNNPGSVPGLNLSAITSFHLQGIFANGLPGLAMDLTFDNLALVPEPASLGLLGLGVPVLLRRRIK